MLRTEGDWECSALIMKGGNNPWQPSIRKVDVAEDIVHLDFSKTLTLSNTVTSLLTEGWRTVWMKAQGGG